MEDNSNSSLEQKIKEDTSPPQTNESMIQTQRSIIVTDRHPKDARPLSISASTKPADLEDNALIPWIKNICLAIILLVNLFERPYYCTTSAYNDDCSPKTSNGTTVTFYRSGFPIWSPVLIFIVDLLALLPLLAVKIYRHTYKDVKGDSTRREIVLIIIGSLILFLDIYTMASGPMALQFEMYLRPIFFMIYKAPIRKTFILYLNIVYKVKELLSIMALNILMFTLLGEGLFEGTTEEKTRFPTFWETALQLVILQTTANFPDVMLPAYKDNRWAFLFFFVFLIIQYFLLVNLTISFMYYHYNTEMQEKKREHFQRLQAKKTIRGILDKSNVLASPRSAVTTPLNPVQPGEVVVQKSEVPGVSVEVVTLDPYEKSSIFMRLDESVAFSVFLSLLSFATFVIYAITTFQTDIDNIDGRLIVLILNVVILVGPIVSIIAYQGFRGMDSDKFLFWIYDALSSLAIVVLVALYKYNSSSGLLPYIKIAILARMLRVYQILALIPSYQVIFATIRKVVPLFADILGVLLVIFYTYNITGIHVLGGKINGNVDLSNTGVPPEYIMNNFNDFASGLVTLFELLLINNWNFQMELFARAYGSNWIKLLFISFYFVGYLVALGIILAFIIGVIVDSLAIDKVELDASTSPIKVSSPESKPTEEKKDV